MTVTSTHESETPSENVSGDTPITIAFGKSHRAKLWKNKQSTVTDLMGLLEDHQEGPKEGPAFLQGSTRNSGREAGDMERLDIIGIDIDDGTPSEALDALVEASDLFCIRYTTHSHRAEKHKNRLIFVLAKPWVATDYPGQREAREGWKAAYEALCSFLRVNFDASCTDPCRLFFLPRHDADAPYGTVVHEGRAVDIFSLPKATAASGPRGSKFLATAATDGARAWEPGSMESQVYTVREYNQLAEIIRHEAEHLILEDKGDGLIIRCPNDAEHSNPGDPYDRACLVRSAGDNPDKSEKAFVFACQHEHCREVGKVEMACMLIRSGDVSEEAFFAWEYNPGAPGVIPDLESVNDAAGATAYLRVVAENAPSPVACADHVERLAKRLASVGVKLGKTVLAKELSEAVRAASKMNAERSRGSARRVSEGDGVPTIYNDTDYNEAVDIALTALASANVENPTLFIRAGGAARVVRDEPGSPVRVAQMSREEMRYELGKLVQYREGKSQRRAPPSDEIVDHIRAMEAASLRLPPIDGIVFAPVFGKDGCINTSPGYDHSSRVYFDAPVGLNVPDVAPEPVQGDVEKALDLLLGNVLVDFPFDGPNKGASERAHALSMILLPFARQLINGSTPIHLIEKPTPGTGASKLVNIYSLITEGIEASAQTETKNDDELRKRITSFLLEAGTTFYLDNINRRIEGSEIASALTTGRWTDRLLGSTKTVNVPVRCTWIFAANNPDMSNEIRRRCIRIRLDAKVERPELRTNFKHKDLEGWVREHRGELIWACLTLIQNWIAKDRPDGNVRVKGSFESWSRTMGGILDCAGVGGFLGNEDELRKRADSEGNAIRDFLSVWWDTYEEQPATVGSSGPDTSDGLFHDCREAVDALPINGQTDAARKVSLGKYIGKLEDRIFTIDDAGAVRVTRGEKDAKNKRETWRLARVH